MDIEKINKDLIDRFNKPYDEFYHRRIIFWIDEEGEFAEEIDNLVIDGVKVLKLSEDNLFITKKILNYDDALSDYLVYVPIIFKDIEDNWLMDMMLYSEIYRADLISIQTQEMNLDEDINLRPTIKKYKKFFNAKARRNNIRNFADDIINSYSLEIAIISVIASTDMNPELIIREVLKNGLSNDGNEIYEKILNYEIQDSFWTLVEENTGYNSDRNLYNLFKHILITASCRNIDVRAFNGLGDFISSSHEDFCFQFIHNWMRDSYDGDIFKKYSLDVEMDLSLYNRLMNLNVYDFYLNEFFSCVDEVILVKALTNIKDDIFDLDFINNICEKRRVTFWYSDFKFYYEVIYFIGRMKDFYNKNQNSFHMGSSDEIWNSYADTHYIMDTYYRKFQKNYQLSLKSSNSNIDDLIKYAVSRAEGIYSNWFLNKILSNWTGASKDYYESYGYIEGLKQQVNFYKDNISDMDSRVFVIISDAMRYEVARELYLELEKDMQCKVSIDNMEGVFPTITSFGMAALLPNDGLDVKKIGDNLKVEIRGESTNMNNREKVLQMYNKKSKVLKYDEFIQMKTDDRKSAIKGMEVIYIYHDKIDKTSHTSDDEVFYACDEAIREIKNLVRILTSLSAINIFITSDHGFLYTYGEFTEDSKVDNAFREDSLEYSRRYVIAAGDVESNYLMPIYFKDFNEDLSAFAARDNIRIKKHGGGVNFVHGGISLQEKMVPLIKFKHLRNDSLEYRRNKDKYDVKPVEINLLSNSRKISNMTFNLSFYQTEMLSANREAAKFVICFEDDKGNRISDEVRIIADRYISNEKDRIYNEIFNLNAGSYDNKKTYYLKIYDTSGKLDTKEYEFTIDIPIAAY